jgi:hypothetical protein
MAWQYSYRKAVDKRCVAPFPTVSQTAGDLAGRFGQGGAAEVVQPDVGRRDGPPRSARDEDGELVTVTAPQPLLTDLLLK